MGRAAVKTAGEPPQATGSLYETDFHGWVEQQVALLRAGRLDAIEAEHIAEELNDTRQSHYHRLQSALKVLVMHMLKWDQQPEHRSASWLGSIREQRRRVGACCARIRA